MLKNMPFKGEGCLEVTGTGSDPVWVVCDGCRHEGAAGDYISYVPVGSCGIWAERVVS